MQIKKGEIITLMSGVYRDRHRPMIATQDFDLAAVTADITAGMDKIDRDQEIYVIDEILEARGLLQPVQSREICFDYWSEELVIEEKPYQRMLAGKSDD